jgi:two-component sensor histidine kinase/tetratricopeptide (TPR) repeat protein
MTKITFIFFFILAGMATNGQHKKIQPKPSASESKIEAYLARGDFHYQNIMNVNYPYAKDSAMYYTGKAETLSRKTQNQFQLANCYITYALILDIQAESAPSKVSYEQSLDYAQKAISIFTSLGNDKKLCDAYYCLLGIQEYKLPIEETILLAEKTRTLSRKIGDKKLEGRILEDIAYYNSLQSEYTKSIKLLNEALKIYGSLKNVNDRIQSVYAYMGALYNELGEANKALQYCLKAIAIAEKYKVNGYGEVDLYNFTGVIYRGLKKYEPALKYFEKAVAIARNLDNRGALAFYEANAAETALFYGDKNKALFYLKEIEKKDDLAYNSEFINALTVLTKSYVTLNDNKKADKYAKIIMLTYNNYNATVYEKEVALSFSSALMTYYFYKKEYNLCRKYALIYKKTVVKSNSKQKIMNAYNMLYQVDSAQAKFESAMSNYRIQSLYKDSLFNETKNKQLTEMQVKYETDEKEKRNLLLKKQAELQQSQLSHANFMKNVSFTGIGILIIGFSMGYRRYSINQRIKKEINLKNETLQKLLNEKEWLLKEIHHRVKNNLQVVMSLLNTQSHFLEDESAKTAIRNSQHRIHSMSLIHKKLYLSNNIITVNMAVYIKELVEYFKDSFDTGQRIRFVLDVTPVELTSTQSVPLSLILNETIMNSLKHAFPDEREGTIAISLVSLPENRVKLTIKDDGIGLQEDFNDQKSSPSLGMKLIEGFSGELNADLKFINNNGLAVVIEFTDTKTANTHL